MVMSPAQVCGPIPDIRYLGEPDVRVSTEAAESGHENALACFERRKNPDRLQIQAMKTYVDECSIDHDTSNHMYSKRKVTLELPRQETHYE